jgi:NTP pyrophosphatase (non-canonical NTP hydrolase)
MQMTEYQIQATATAVYPGQGTIMGLAYVGLGLGEAGEVQGKIKKLLRDDNGAISDEKRLAIAAELGDLLWYVAQACNELDIRLHDVARLNLAKLADRAERGVLQGSGDTR